MQALSLVWKIRKILNTHVFALLKPLINPFRVLQVGQLQRLSRSVACLCIASSWSHSQRTMPSWHTFPEHEAFRRTPRWNEFPRHVDISNDLQPWVLEKIGLHFTDENVHATLHEILRFQELSPDSSWLLDSRAKVGKQISTWLLDSQNASQGLFTW